MLSRALNKLPDFEKHGSYVFEGHCVPRIPITQEGPEKRREVRRDGSGVGRELKSLEYMKYLTRMKRRSTQAGCPVEGKNLSRDKANIRYVVMSQFFSKIVEYQ